MAEAFITMSSTPTPTSGPRRSNRRKTPSLKVLMNEERLSECVCRGGNRLTVRGGEDLAESAMEEAREAGASYTPISETIISSNDDTDLPFPALTLSEVDEIYREHQALVAAYRAEKRDKLQERAARLHAHAREHARAALAVDVEYRRAQAMVAMLRRNLRFGLGNLRIYETKIVEMEERAAERVLVGTTLGAHLDRQVEAYRVIREDAGNNPDAKAVDA